jgi:hydroxymethylbilane synthase
LAALDGSCRTPIAGLAEIEDERLVFRGEVLTPDGRNFWRVSRDISFDGAMGEYARTKAYAAGQDAAREIREHAGAKLPRF